MLAIGAAKPVASGSAPIEWIEAPAAPLPLPDASVDVVTCQQGLQFFPDKPAALAEMSRVLRPGGTVALAVWDAGHRLQPFEEYTEALADAGVEPPFEHAFERALFVADPGRIRQLLQDAGFDNIEVTVATATLAWPEPGLAAAGIMGTPFAPLVQALGAERRRALQADLLRRFEAETAGEPVRRESASVIARAG
jgi:SAM-dependent methyltransferase